MKVFKLGVADGRELVVPAPLTGTVLNSVAGVQQGDAWRPIAVELCTEDDGQRLQTVDCPFLNSAFLVIKDQALPRVRDALAPYAEFLPLHCPQAAMSAVNVLTIVDALDDKRTEGSRFSDGRLMIIDRHFFHSDRVPVEGMFRTPRRASPIYCTEPTADFLRQQLTGLDLREVWEG